MAQRRVVVTGMGAISPIGNSLEETWKSALAGVSGVGRITRFDAEGFSCQIAGEIQDFDPKSCIDAKDLKKLDLFSQYALYAGEQAWNSSKLGEASYQPSRMGCILGVGMGGLGTLERYHQAYLEGGPRKISPFLIPAMISNLGPGNLAIRFGLKGINYTITSACTSATHSIGEAYRLIANDLQDVVLTGGSESTVSPIGIGGFCAMKALSTRNDDPKAASRPFDKDRDGFVMGEGGGILVLESLEEAERRGATIWAEVVGYGSSCDAYHITSPSADGEGAIACMSAALKDADLQPEQIGYLNAHGTSTQANDVTESKAIGQVFGAHAREGLLVSSTKSMTGHLLGAAGAIEAIFSILAVKESKVPPTINLDEPGEGCDLDYVPNKAREVKISAAMSNSFGFGGTNASIVIKSID